MGGMEIDTPASESVGDSMEFHSERVTVSQAFRSAFVASMDGVDLFDIKLWAYTKRRSDDAGNVSLCQPRAIPASAACLRDITDHFEKALTGGFKESHVVDISGDYAERVVPASKVGFFYAPYDSDLEDEDEDEGVPDVRPLTSNAPSPRSRGARSPPTGMPPATDDFTLRDMARSLPSDDDASSVPRSANRTQRQQATPTSTKSGYHLPIPHVAHRTLRAFVFYSVFGVVDFAPLRSQRGVSLGAADVDRDQQLQRSSMAPSCSPKSMYRLADEWNIPKLKALALDAIESRLSAENIMSELLCPCTPIYSEVEAMEVEYFMEHMAAAHQAIQATTIAPLDLKITATSSQAASNIIFQLMRRLLAQ